MQEPLSSANNNPICRVYFGRLKASKYFFRAPESRKDKRLWDALRAIAGSYKGYLSQKLTVDKLQYELNEANAKTLELRRHLDDLVSKCAFTYSCMENPNIRPDMIIHGADSVTKDMRDQIHLNCRLIKYIYCADTVLDNADPDIIEITNQSLEVLNDTYQTPSPRVSSPKKDQSRQSTAKQTPSRMEAEKQPY